MTFPHATITRSTILASVLGIAVMGFNGAAVAESSNEPAASQGDAAATMEQLQAKRQELQQLMRKLQSIQQNATNAEPELEADQQDFRDLLMATMQGEDYDPEVEVERMRSLQSELQGAGELDEAERQAKAQALRQTQQKFRKKQQEAMQTEDVRAARKALNEKMIAAMKEQNPRTRELLAQLDQLQREYRSLLQEVMKQKQGGAQTPQG